ncbi:hypothetical protein BHF69_11715 [Anaerostipes sp. 992a]|nr:hypothetical protein BHF69_11715 [Anaerostipes sp. 992a]
MYKKYKNIDRKKERYYNVIIRLVGPIKGLHFELFFRNNWYDQFVLEMLFISHFNFLLNIYIKPRRTADKEFFIRRSSLVVVVNV